MNRKLMKWTMSAFALTLVMYGCEGLSESALVGPGERSEILIIEKDTTTGYTIARETDPAVGVVSSIIDENGGSLSIGNHVLTVPVGAVDGPTTFTMTKLVDQIEVGLEATRLLPNDVGHAGFHVPVTLSLSYANASEVPADLSRLQIVWVKPDGQMEAQPSALNAEGSAVIGSLSHFSGYALADPTE